jgi:hypothetical protein
MGQSANKRAYLPHTLVSHLHYDGKRLVPWLITVEKKDGSIEERRRSDGRLIVLRTNRCGERTIIEQAGHPIPEELPSAIGARVKRLKRPKDEEKRAA